MREPIRPGREAVQPRNRVAVELAAATAFAALTAVGARVQFHLPFTPVPVTGQVFCVLLAGAVLGARLGFVSQVEYLAAGAAGLRAGRPVVRGFRRAASRRGGLLPDHRRRHRRDRARPGSGRSGSHAIERSSVPVAAPRLRGRDIIDIWLPKSRFGLAAAVFSRYLL